MVVSFLFERKGIESDMTKKTVRVVSLEDAKKLVKGGGVK